VHSGLARLWVYLHVAFRAADWSPAFGDEGVKKLRAVTDKWCRISVGHDWRAPPSCWNGPVLKGHPADLLARLLELRRCSAPPDFLTLSNRRALEAAKAESDG
jgi:hypothetical protein